MLKNSKKTKEIEVMEEINFEEAQTKNNEKKVIDIEFEEFDETKFDETKNLKVKNENKYRYLSSYSLQELQKMIEKINEEIKETQNFKNELEKKLIKLHKDKSKVRKAMIEKLMKEEKEECLVKIKKTLS